MTARGGGRLGVEGVSKKGQGRMNMDTSEVIAVSWEKDGIRGLNGNGKNTIKKSIDHKTNKQTNKRFNSGSYLVGKYSMIRCVNK